MANFAQTPKDGLRSPGYGLGQPNRVLGSEPTPASGLPRQIANLERTAETLLKACEALESRLIALTTLEEGPAEIYCPQEPIPGNASSAVQALAELNARYISAANRLYALMQRLDV